MQIIIEEQTYNKMMYLLDLGLKKNSEVSGYANVELRDDNTTFYISDAVMPKQEGSSGATEIDDHAKAKLMYERREMPFGMKCHWHTHPKMGAFWSGTDEALIRKLGGNGWMVFLVMNEKEEIKGAFYEIVDRHMINGRRHDKVELFYKDVSVSIETDALDDATAKAWDQEFTENWTGFTYTTGRGKWNSTTQKWEDKEQTSFPIHGVGKNVAPISTPIYTRNRSGIYAYQGNYDQEAFDDMSNVNFLEDEDVENGWINYGGSLYYNPLKDKELPKDFKQQVEAMISYCSWEDCEDMSKHSSRFKKFFNRAIEYYGEETLMKIMKEAQHG